MQPDPRAAAAVATITLAAIPTATHTPPGTRSSQGHEAPAHREEAMSTDYPTQAEREQARSLQHQRTQAQAESARQATQRAQQNARENARQTSKTAKG